MNSGSQIMMVEPGCDSSRTAVDGEPGGGNSHAEFYTKGQITRLCQTAAGTSLTMADGNSVDVSLQGEDLYVEETRVVTTDVQASNGVIHFIDKVMMPELNRPRPPGGD